MLEVFKQFLKQMRSSDYDGFDVIGAMIDCGDEHLFCQHALGDTRVNVSEFFSELYLPLNCKKVYFLGVNEALWCFAPIAWIARY